MKHSHQRFNGQAVLVTGSTRGIGRAIAERLASEGAVVGIHGRDRDSVDRVCRELAAQGAPAPIALTGDLDDSTTARDLVSAFHKQAGRLDGLVNNAGGGKAAAFRGLSLDRCRATFRLNFDAAFESLQAAYPILRDQRRGAVVNVASLAAHGPGKWMGADYAAAKAALVSLTKSFAFEAARFGIRVNAVSPGLIETDMTGALTDDLKRSLAIPMGRLGRPAEVAAATAFLLSDDSAYITGQVIHVNGGLYM